MKKKPNLIHITSEAYEELQRQIQREIDAMEDESRKSIEIEADLPDYAAIYLTVEMYAKVTKSKFIDGARGALQLFTETNWECTCEITGIRVFDGNDKDWNPVPVVWFFHYFTAVTASQCLGSFRCMVMLLNPAAVREALTSSGV